MRPYGYVSFINDHGITKQLLETIARSMYETKPVLFRIEVGIPKHQLGKAALVLSAIL